MIMISAGEVVLGLIMVAIWIDLRPKVKGIHEILEEIKKMSES